MKFTILFTFALIVHHSLLSQEIKTGIRIADLHKIYREIYKVDARYVTVANQTFFAFNHEVNDLHKDHPLAELVNSKKYLFLYLISNWTGISKETKESLFKKSDLFPNNYYNFLENDSTFNHHFLKIISNYLELKGQHLNGYSKKLSSVNVSIDRIMDIASRFFFPDNITEKGNIQVHICVGINGLKDMEKGRDPLLEAFAYQVINSEFETFEYGFLNSFRIALKELGTCDISSDTEIKIARAQGAIWYSMHYDKLLKRALQIEMGEIGPIIGYSISD